MTHRIHIRAGRCVYLYKHVHLLMPSYFCFVHHDVAIWDCDFIWSHLYRSIFVSLMETESTCRTKRSLESEVETSQRLSNSGTKPHTADSNLRSRRRIGQRPRPSDAQLGSDRQRAYIADKFGHEVTIVRRKFWRRDAVICAHDAKAIHLCCHSYAMFCDYAFSCTMTMFCCVEFQMQTTWRHLLAHAIIVVLYTAWHDIFAVVTQLSVDTTQCSCSQSVMLHMVFFESFVLSSRTRFLD